MDVLGSTGQVQLNLARTQIDLGKQASALASGLRVQSASDDPSGLAIAETIQSKVSGLQQGVSNVQTANNLLNVADSTLSTVQGILQRIHSLIVEARSDINSNGDLENIQTEIDSLLQEINKISSDANFNGLKLFNGSLDPNSAIQQLPTVTQENSEPNANGTLANSTVANADGFGNSGPLITPHPLGVINSIAALLEFRVIGFTNNADPAQGPLGPDVILQLSAFSTDPSFAAEPELVDTALIGVNSGPILGVSTPSPSGAGTLLQFDISNLTAADVGAAATFLTNVPPTVTPTATPPSALTVNFGGTEGSTVSIALPDVSTTTLNISNISVIAPGFVNFNNVVQGQSSSNQLAADDAEIRVQVALDSISSTRAQVGAQSVSLSESADDSSVQIVNQIASESAIRDANIGQTVGAFTKDQILTQIGTSVLSQAQTDARQVTQLLISAINTAGGGGGATLAGG